MNILKVSRAKFIKLGQGGIWENICIENKQLRFGFNNPHHQDALNRDFSKIKLFLSQSGKTKGKITEIINAIDEFYFAGEDVLWITFYNKSLYWCIANGPAIELEDGSRVRNTINGWSSLSVNGNPLTIDRLSGRLTKVQMYRGTVCDVEEFEYLVNKINDQLSPNSENVSNALAHLKVGLVELIRSLTWQDFENLIDLLFSGSGYKRLGVLGKNEKDIDLDLLHTLTGRRAFVQIKAASNQKEFDGYVEKYLNNGSYSEMFYFVHTLDVNLTNPNAEDAIKIIGVNEISELVVNSGLIEWVINKSM